jgi:hypothetical protein
MALIHVSKSYSARYCSQGDVAKSVGQIKDGTTLNDAPSGYLEIAPFIGLFELASALGDIEHNQKSCALKLILEFSVSPG